MGGGIVFDAVALGELLIDFTPQKDSGQGNPMFVCNPGGAPANVLAVLAMLGKRCAFIGKVGNDQFGSFLRGILDDLKINTTGLIGSNEVNTTLAFVHLNESGDRSFSFYRKPGADIMLDEQEVKFDLIKNSKVFHFGSVSLTDEPCRTATLKAVEFARNNNVLISFDPNLRVALWNNLEEAKKMIKIGLGYTDVLKISDEELEFLTDCKDLKEGTRILWKEFGIKLIFVTLGPKGCFYRRGEDTGETFAYDVDTIDTTGAGDSFLGSALFQILDRNKKINDFSVGELDEIVDFASAASSLSTTKKGAIPSIPLLHDIKESMGQIKKLVI
jgi:fructokinase